VTTFILGGSVLEGVISENVTVELLMKYEEVKKKGKTHMKYVSGKTKIQPGSVFFRFENLFNGDKCDANSNQHGQQILCQSVNRGGF
jgi:hypothetical protein